MQLDSTTGIVRIYGPMIPERTDRDAAAPTPRIAWIDTARGVAMLAIVLGHMVPGGPLHAALYWWHIPLCFMLAGVAMRSPVGFDAAWTWWERRARQLLLPYVRYLVGVACVAMPLLGPWSWRGLAWQARALVLGGRQLGGIFGTFWFVPVLFLAQGLALLVSHQSRRGRWIALGTLYALSHLVRGLALPWSLEAVPLATIYVLIGMAVRPWT